MNNKFIYYCTFYEGETYMCKQTKIQNLLWEQLKTKGHVELFLPDGMVLELGVVAEGKYGELEKREDYCWLIASQRNRTISIDSYNVGLRYASDDKFVFEDSVCDEDGKVIKTLDLI